MLYKLKGVFILGRPYKGHHLHTGVREKVFKRDNYKCVYCGASGNGIRLEIDHVIPISNGGSHCMRNLVTSCRACNRRKGARLPDDRTKTALAKLLNTSVS